MQIIGIIGRKHVGKDTLADYVQHHFGYKKVSFADPLKKSLKILFGFDDDQLYGNKKEIVDYNWGVTPRKVMQYIGTEIFRKKINELLPDINEDFWIKLLEINCKKLLEKGEKIIIADIRFQNEADMLKKLEGFLIKMDKDNVEKDSYENNIDELKGDDIINNNGTIDELFKKFDKCYIEFYQFQ